jgi:uncharacterized membrane protein HdeD (DUF308 family)
MPVGTLSPGAVLGHELQALHKQWWCFLLLGITMVVLGTLAIADPFITSFTTFAAVLILGFVLMVAGIMQIISSFWAGKWSGMLLHMLIGVLYGVTGYMIIDQPGVSMLVLTKFIAIFLIVAGVFRIVTALVTRFNDWGWVLLNGVISLLLGLIINRQMPEAALWVIGLFIGIELLFNGWAWIMLSLGLRRIGTAAPAATAV